MTGVKLEIVAAVAANSVIGNEGKLPWHIPEDLEWFKEYTMGGVCVVGRKTYEHLPPLPDRTLFVASSDGLTIVKNANGWAQRTFMATVDTLNLTIHYARLNALKLGLNRVFVLGGENVFLQTLEQADTLTLTHVHDLPYGDTQFPRFSVDDFNFKPLATGDGWSRVRYERVEEGAYA